MNANEPKHCQLCTFVDSLGECVTCPNDGEASWGPLVPTFVPEPEPEADPEPEAEPAATTSAFPSKKKRK